MSGGVEFLLERNVLIYDSGMGSDDTQEKPRVLTAKQLSQLLIDAVETVRQVPGHQDFTPAAYATLKQNLRYRLRSVGSP